MTQPFAARGKDYAEVETNWLNAERVLNRE